MKTQLQDQKSEVFWKNVIKRYGKSNLSLKVFLARNCLEEKEFRYWRSRILKLQISNQNIFTPVYIEDISESEASTSKVPSSLFTEKPDVKFRFPSGVEMYLSLEHVSASQIKDLIGVKS